MKKNINETITLNHAPETKKSIRKFLTAKKKGDSHLVAILVIIVITLVLCYLFKTQITTFMTNVFTTMGTKMDTLLGTI